jgi:hypothetical protein
MFRSIDQQRGSVMWAFIVSLTVGHAGIIWPPGGTPGTERFQ